jgi:hypothetical protein
MLANLLGASRIFLVMVLSLSSASCGSSNMLESFSNTEDDPSLYAAALKYINTNYYGDAVEACETMSATYRTGTARFVCASAYAGRCGYTMTSVATLLGGYNPTTNPVKVLRFLLQSYPTGTTSQRADCETASVLLRTGGAAADRTDDENFMMILMSLTHLGVAMNSLADLDNDNVIDVGFDQCDSAVDFTNTAVSEVGRAFWDIYQSALAINSTLTTQLVTAMGAMNLALNTYNATYNFIAPAANPNSYTAAQRAGIRAMVAEDSLAGLDLGTCTDFTNCVALCP